MARRRSLASTRQPFQLWRSMIVVLSALPVASSAAAQSTIEQIDPFASTVPSPIAEAHGISGGGTVVVGTASSGSLTETAFMFVNGGLIALDPSGTLPRSIAYDASEDGAVVIGDMELSGVGTRAFYWTQATGIVSAPPMLGGDSNANAISGDGRIIVGQMSSAALPQRAFVWDRINGSVTDIGTLRSDLAGFARANGVNGNGNVVVGGAAASSAFHAFRWTASGGMEDLGTIGGALGFSEALAVSKDGDTVVGRSITPLPVDNRAFRWTRATGMQHLVAPDEADIRESRATAVSGDGSFVAGFTVGISPKQSKAIRWDAAGDGLYLGDLTANNSGNSQATGISDDGSIVVGRSTFDASGDWRGFIWRENGASPTGTMLDHVNTLTQVSNAAAAQAAGVTMLASQSQFVLGQEVAPVAGGASGGFLSSSGKGRSPIALRVAAGASHAPDGKELVIGGLSASTPVGQNLTFGGYLGFGSDRDDLADFGIDGNFAAFGLYLRGGQVGAEGLNWKIAASQVAADVTITRTTALANTERGTGDSSMRARSASIEIGYGFVQGQMLITPYARLARTVSTRDGYSETTDAAFPVRYDDYEISETTATIGANIGTALGDNGFLTLSAGMAWDLSRNAGDVTGTSDIPGMTNFAISGPVLEHEQRLFAEARYVHQLGKGRAYDVGIGLHQTPYAEKPSLTATIGYSMSF
ncbi:autotransporter domain-containing protein [Aliiroseovarius sp. S253]|uniref:autotransporter domain-containing protein n=1 Tax=Aliiroseovarius sp. S253 TaxID=3415133 RepID=UPI003C7A6C15